MIATMNDDREEERVVVAEGGHTERQPVLLREADDGNAGPEADPKPPLNAAPRPHVVLPPEMVPHRDPAGQQGPEHKKVKE